MKVCTRCLKCGKSWNTELVVDTELTLVAYTFCGSCRKEMTESFERQFEMKRLTKRIRFEENEDDGA